MFAWQFAKMLHALMRIDWSRFISMQNHYNMVYREEEREMVPLCLIRRDRIASMESLARGFLAGNRNREKGGETLSSKSDEYAQSMYYQESDFQIVDRVAEIAAKEKYAGTNCTCVDFT